jgi:hypothetical protein
MCCDTTKEIKRHNIELLCQWMKSMPTDVTRSQSQKILEVKWKEMMMGKQLSENIRV